MNFKLEINCDNATFQDKHLKYKVLGILQKVRKRISNNPILSGCKNAIFDTNGNTVGRYQFTDTEEICDNCIHENNDAYEIPCDHCSKKYRNEFKAK